VVSLATGVPEVLAPDQRSLEVVRQQPLRAEVNVDPFAVGHRGRGSVGVHPVPVVEHPPVMCRPTPENGSAFGIERDHLERMAPIPALAVGVQVHLAVANVLRGRGAFDGFALDIGGDEDSISPDDGRGVSAALDRRLPKDVLSGAPLERQTRLARNAVAVRPPPLRPVRLFGGDGRGDEKEKGQHAAGW